MTGWVDISNTAIDQDSPITVSLVTALRDNPRAITEGASGAPKMQTAGINDSAVTNAKVADNTLAWQKIAAPSSSTSFVVYSCNYGDTPASSLSGYPLSESLKSAKNGSYTFRVSIWKNSSFGATSVFLYVNGSQVGSTITQSASGTYAAGFNFTVAATDTIEIKFSATSGEATTVRAQICCNYPFPYISEVAV